MRMKRLEQSVHCTAEKYFELADGQRLSCPGKLLRGWGRSGNRQKAVTKIYPVHVVLIVSKCRAVSMDQIWLIELHFT